MNHEDGIDMGEDMVAAEQFTVATVAPEGLGYGEGSINVTDRLADPDDALNESVLQVVRAALDNPAILISIDRDKQGELLDDDGCGDGRGTGLIFEGLKQRAKSLVRPKIFGGAQVMLGASLIGLGRATGKKLNALYAGAVNHLAERGISFGGHSDEHAHGENCGCGAIDKAPQIIKAVIEHEDSIRASIDVLGVDTDGLDDIFDEYKNYFESDVVGHEDEYSGKQTLNELVNNGKVVKELVGPHLEVAVVLNMVSGKTVNQDLIREVSGGAAQVFAVDVPRLEDIANRSFDTESDQKRAFLSMLVHTLGVAATLTKGDLPVYAISSADAPVEAV